MTPDPQGPPKVTLNVAKPGTTAFQEEYNLNNKVEKIRKDAATRFGVTEADLAKFNMYMEYGDGRPRRQMSINDKIEDYAPADGDTVVFEQRDDQFGSL